MTPAQSEVYQIIREYWARYYCAPSYRDIARIRGKNGLGNIGKIITRLEKLGAVKRKRGSRSVRPSDLRYRDI
jgi:SOS-response transcriptional repressor LexA